MSALVGVVKTRSIDLLADAACIRTLDGVVTKIQPKIDVASVPGCAIAAIGIWQSFAEFTRLARHRALANFDSLAAACNEIWGDAKSILPSDAINGLDYGVLIAGWSAGQQTFGMLAIDTGIAPRAEVFDIFAVGGSDESDLALDAFMARFGEQLEAFRPRRDGLGLIKELRTHRRDFGMFGRHSAVGGYVQHVHVTRTGIASKIIHAWPDRIGEVMRLDASHDCKQDFWWKPGQTFPQRGPRLGAALAGR